MGHRVHALIDLVHDSVLIDQHGKGLPHFRVRQQRIGYVEVEIGDAEARHDRIAEPVVIGQTLDVLGRKRRLNDVEIASLERLRTGRIVADDLERDVLDFRSSTPVVLIGLELDVAAAVPGRKLHRPGADRLERYIGTAFDCGLGDDAHVQIRQQRRIGRREIELHGALIDRLDGVDRSVERALGRVEIGIEDGLVGEHHILGGQRAAVRKCKVGPQCENDCLRIGAFPALGEFGDRFEVGRDFDKAGIDEIGGARRRRVARQPWIERTGVNIGADDDGVGFLRDQRCGRSQRNGNGRCGGKEKCLHDCSL